MRILICDDDELIIEKLKKYLILYFSKNNIKTFEIVAYRSGEEVLADTGSKDIVFLDVEMSGLDGIYVGAELKKQNEKIIIFIVTSYSEYLDDAMRFHVFRYLSKPIDKDRLFRNLKDAVKLYNTSVHKVIIETKYSTVTIYSSDIIFIENSKRKTIIHTIKEDYVTTKNINYWINELSDIHCFFSTHKSFIVNFEHITEFDHSLIYFDGYKDNAYISKRRYKDFKDAYLMYLKSMR